MAGTRGRPPHSRGRFEEIYLRGQELRATARPGVAVCGGGCFGLLGAGVVAGLGAGVGVSRGRRLRLLGAGIVAGLGARFASAVGVPSGWCDSRAVSETLVPKLRPSSCWAPL